MIFNTMTFHGWQGYLADFRQSCIRHGATSDNLLFQQESPRDGVSFLGDSVKIQLQSSEVFCRSAVQSLSRVQLFGTPWTAAHQASLSITNSQSLRKLMSFELVMPSNHLILCHPLLLLPPIFPSIRVFSDESALGCPNAVTRGSFWFFRQKQQVISHSKANTFWQQHFFIYSFIRAFKMKQFCLHVKLNLASLLPSKKQKQKLSLSSQIKHCFYIVYNRSLIFIKELITLDMGLSE